ncbi:MAG: hypothetical protein FWD94_08620, partial [Treponema sp.]|nr:hypothetical protein [Treponema sp.]
MRKKVFPRLILALAVAMSAFVLLGALQFARYGGFSRQILGMTVSGRLINGAGNVDSWEIALDGGTGVVFGGLEFRLDEASGANSGNGVPEPGFYFRDGGNVLRPAVPEFLNTTEDSAIFLLNSGAELSFTVFSGPEGLPELRISGSFPAGIGSMDIPFRPRRSTVAWDNTQGRLGVIYDGARYGFRRHSPELTEGRLLLSAERPMASYRMLPGVPEMAVADLAVPEMLAPDSFAAKLAAWIDLSFVRWGTAGREIGTESMTALSAEALRRGIFGAAVAEVEVGFAPRMEGTAAFFDLERRPGFWSREVRVLEPADGQRLDEIAGMLARRNYRGLFAENRPLAFLALYGRDDL